jgi:vancomycin permeability regulator SanA
MSLVRKRERLFRQLAILALAAAAGSLAWAAPYMLLARHQSARLYRQIDAVPPRPVAIVFGALVDRGGRLSPVLRARVDSAVALYKAGKVRKLLMTGDNGSNRYDEVTPMKAYAVSKGVPAGNIVRDYAGFRTYDSCWRAKRIFGVDRAILVTQAYHLPRALYLADTVGIDAIGFVAPDCATPNEVAGFERREANAVILAYLDTHVFGRKPRFGGKREPIFGDDSPGR